MMSKRKRNALEDAYESFIYTKIESTGRPGTPHRYFAESFRLDAAADACTNTTKQPTTIIHRHANGLCVVTCDNVKDVQSIDFQVAVPDPTSAAEKRKKHAKVLQGKQVDDLVRPNDCLAKLSTQNGIVEVPCGVLGTVLDLNVNVTPRLLESDPLLDGHLAVIMPSGPFPGSSQKKAKGGD